MFGAHAIEHGSTRPGRWLREHRFRLTFWVAAVEGVLYLVHVLHWWEAVVLALVALGFWWFVGNEHRSDLVRQLSWVFAASQLIVLCVPLALGILKVIAIAVIAVLAVVALVLVFARRPRA